MSFDINDLNRRMKGAIDNLKNDLKGLRTGRASVNLLDPVMVEAYGSKVPLNQIGNVSTPEARLITVTVWDKSMLKSTEKAIRNSGLGLNPVADGMTIRIPLPDLTEERRKELTKVAGKYGESSKIAIRNVRRDGMDILKKLEKDSDIGKDEQKNQGENTQKITDKFVTEVDLLVSAKEKEIMQV